jgi:hypothetical protein
VSRFIKIFEDTKNTRKLLFRILNKAALKAIQTEPEPKQEKLVQACSFTIPNMIGIGHVVSTG